MFITVDATAADVAKVAVNRELAAQYAAALGELADLCGAADYRPAPETLARFPEVLTVTKEDEDLETVSADLCAVLDEALSAYNAMRAVEGRKLAEGKNFDLGEGFKVLGPLHMHCFTEAPEI